MGPMPPYMMVICHSCSGEKIDYSGMVSEDCSACEGRGSLDEVECPACEGDGCPRCFDEGSLYDLQCSPCNGFGEVDHYPQCPDCNGTGWHPHPAFFTK